MEKDFKAAFQKRIANNLTDFNRKMDQNQLFQIQERLAEKIIDHVRQDMSISGKIAELAVYEENTKNLAATGKTYKNVLEEKIFTDGFRIFEEFLANIFTSIFKVFPNLLIEKDKNTIDVPFEFIFINPDIERSQNIIIENKVKTYLQGDNISKIIERFETTFYLKMNISKDQKTETQRISLVRNVITHNNAIINEIYLRAIQTFEIRNDPYTLGDSVLSKLESEINDQRRLFRQVSTEIIKDLESEDNFKNLYNRHQKPIK